MANWRWLWGAMLFILLASCKQGRNPLNPRLLQSVEPQYRTVTEEATPLLDITNWQGPRLGPPPFGPDVPPPPPGLMFDPLTSGPSLPPPPPPFDDEGEPSRPLIVVPQCGDRILNLIPGTTLPVYGPPWICEDGNNISGDGCSDICIEEFCGNGYVEPEHGEQCDGGLVGTFNGVMSPLVGTPQAYNCDKYCRYIICGDGVVELGGVASGGHDAMLAEQCDLGPRNGGCSGCTTQCTLVSPCGGPDTSPMCECNVPTPTCPNKPGEVPPCDD